MRKIKMIISIIIIFSICFIPHISNADAETSDGGGGTKVEDVLPSDYKPNLDTGGVLAKDISGKIVGSIQAIGSVVAAATFLIIGIRYMIGSIEDRATYKETMIPYLIGAVMVFATSNLVKILYDTFIFTSFTG